MNILVLNYRDRRNPHAGGAEVHLHEIFSRISSQGHQVHLFTTRFASAPSEDMIDGVHVHRIGTDLSFLFVVLFNLRKWIRLYSIDLVFEDLNKIPFYTPFYRSIPKLVQVHHMWGMSIFKEASFPAALYVWLHEQMIRFVYRSTLFTSVSPSTSEELKGLGIAEKQISTIYNGLGNGSFCPGFKDRDTPYFLWLGRLRKYKGVYVALEGFAEFAKKNPLHHLVFAGTGPELENLKKETRKLGLEERVRFTGFVSDEKRLKLLQGAQALLQTSYKEGWGLTVIEANACGTIAIASNAPGLRDSVINNKTGLLFEMGDRLALSEKLKYVAFNSQALLEMETEAIKWSQQYNWERSAKETMTLIQKIVNRSEEGVYG